MDKIALIKAKIERLIAEYDKWIEEQGVRREELASLKEDFIDTLSEEPASKGYDEAYLNEKIAKASKTWEGVDVDKYMDEIRGREPDKSLEEAAEEYADETYYAYPPEFLDFVKDEIGGAFIAGAKWQAEQFEKNRLAACEKQTKEEYDREMEFAASIIEKEHRQPTFSDAINYGIEWQKKQIPMPEDTVIFNKGVAEGKRLMLEDAVEGFVAAHLTSEGTKITVNSGYLPKEMCIKPGEKVRIIVCKKED